MSGFTPDQISAFLEEANLATQSAREVREYHRKRTIRADQQRRDDINLALERIKAAMSPLRSEIGRFHKQPTSDVVLDRQRKIREASKALQRERRKLWKMLNTSERTT